MALDGVLKGQDAFAEHEKRIGRADIGLVDRDFLERVAEQFRVLEIDRCDGGEFRLNQARHVAASADAGFPDDPAALLFREPRCGDKEQKLEAAEHFLRMTAEPGIGCELDASPMEIERFVGDVVSVDPEAFVDGEKMRRGEPARLCACRSQDARQHCGGAALAVRARDDAGAVREGSQIDARLSRD
jgi:hypothetical protein